MILYIGNNIKLTTSNVTTLEQLAKLLTSEGYCLKVCSSENNQIFRLLDMLFNVIKYANKIDYILIDTYSTKNFYYAFLTSQLARILNLKYIPILHGGNLPNRILKSPKMSDLIFNNSYTNVAPSNYLKIAFEAKGYQTTFIPNVLEIAKYKFKKRKIISPKLLYVRAFDKIYNPQLAIYVLAELKKEYPEAQLCMIGPDKDGSMAVCKKLAETFGVENNIEFTGRLTKQEWHKKSEDFDIFINTTNFDNTPVSVMEAMALGLPIVSTNVGGISYLIENYKTGLLVKPNDKNDMVTAIKTLLSNHLLCSGLVECSRGKVAEFDWSVVKEQWNGLLK